MISFKRGMSPKHASFGGKEIKSFIVRLPQDLFKALETEAHEKRVSINLLITEKLQKVSRKPKK